jgi:alpha-galactosidase
MWAMWSAPLIFSELIGTPEQIQNATNPEIFDIDQDPLCIAAQPIQTNDTQMVWVKPLADDSVAVALLNRTRDIPQTIGFTWDQIGMKNSQLATVRDVWDHSDLAVTSGSYTSSVPGQTVQVLRLYPVGGSRNDRFSAFGSGCFRGTNQTGRVSF